MNHSSMVRMWMMLQPVVKSLIFVCGGIRCPLWAPNLVIFQMLLKLDLLPRHILLYWHGFFFVMLLWMLQLMAGLILVLQLAPPSMCNHLLQINNWISEVVLLLPPNLMLHMHVSLMDCLTIGCTQHVQFLTHLQVSSHLKKKYWQSLYQPWLGLTLLVLFYVHSLPYLQELVVSALLYLILYQSLSFLLQCMSLYLAITDIVTEFLLFCWCPCIQYARKVEIRDSKSLNLSNVTTELLSMLILSLQKAVTLAQEKGTSSWLTALPIQEHGFSLHKTAALALRYGWLSSRTPSHCVCGTSFSVEHAFSFSMGGFPSIRYNEVRNLTAELLSEVAMLLTLNFIYSPLMNPLNWKLPILRMGLD